MGWDEMEWGGVGREEEGMGWEERKRGCMRVPFRYSLYVSHMQIGSPLFDSSSIVFVYTRFFDFDFTKTKLVEPFSFFLFSKRMKFLERLLFFLCRIFSSDHFVKILRWDRFSGDSVKKNGVVLISVYRIRQR